MSKIYALTKAGRKVCRDQSLDGDEMKIIEYLKDNKSASDDQLEIIGGSRWLLRSMEGNHLIKELTA